MITRTITGIIMLITTVFLFYIGNLPFTIFITLLSILATKELINIYQLNNYKTQNSLTYILVSLIVFSTSFESIALLWTSPFLLLSLGSICILHCYELAKKNIILKNQISIAYIKIILLISSFAPLFIYIRNLESGLLLLFFISIVIWACDTGAYFSGKTIGKNPLNSISPNKTIEGSLAGIIFGILAGIIFSFYSGLPIYIYAKIAFFITITAQLSDLYESLLKRTANIKDSSNILPGHGGILDRIDSFILTLPTLHIITTLL